MPKQATFPTLYDEVKTLAVSLLRKHGYLRPTQRQSGVLTWSRHGVESGKISILVDTHTSPYLVLDYTCNDTPINYSVQLVSIPSNLGKGVVWYFVCPRTGKRCRKLYLVSTYFYHRSAFRGCMYETQTHSKQTRYFDKLLGGYFHADTLYEQLYKKHFKKQYAGKPTKKYLKLSREIEQAEGIPYHEIERLLMG